MRVEPIMNRIEFIGVSGVGKTTLFHTLLNGRNRKWLTKDELLVRNALHIKNKGLELILYKLLLRMIITENIKIKISKYIISKCSNIDFDAEFSKYNTMLDVFINSCLNDKDIEPFKKYILIKAYAELFYFYYIYNDAFPFNCTVLFDEGIVRKSTILYLDNMFDFMIKSSINIRNVLLPKAVICCEADVSKIIERRKRRNEKGKGTITERNMNEEDLIYNTHISIEYYHKKKDILLNNNVAYLEIDLSDDYTENNADRINTFVCAIL